VSDGKENLEKLAVGDLRGVIGDLHRFRVPGLAGADEFVLGDRSGAAGGSRRWRF